MKILMLIDSLVKGGRERRLIELLKGFKKYKNIETVVVLFSKKVEYPEIHDLNIPIFYLERKPKKDPRVFYRFYSICKKEKPDIVHSWGTMPSIYAIPAVKLLGLKFINASIANAPEKIGWLYGDYFRSKITYPFCDAVVGNSKAGLKAYDAPPSKSHCFYNGFDFKRLAGFKSIESIKDTYQIKTALVTGMVGAFFDRKDYKTYITAAINYLETRQDMTFLAVGDGPNLDEIKALVPQKFKDFILFPGMVHDVESLVNVFDIGVLSTYTEGISNSIMEYMVLGKPVIATDGGGTKELVINGETGYLIAQSNPEEMLIKLQLLAQNPELRIKLGTGGQMRIHKYFTLERMEQDYLKLYNRLLEHRQKNLAIVKSSIPNQ